jgi:hypothetical protein
MLPFCPGLLPPLASLAPSAAPPQTCNTLSYYPYHLKLIPLVVPSPPLVPLAEPNKRGSCFLAVSSVLQAAHSNDAMSTSMPVKWACVSLFFGAWSVFPGP